MEQQVLFYIYKRKFLHLVTYADESFLLVGDLLRSLYQQAGCLRYWMVVRYCSSLLNHTVDSISPFITAVLVKGKQVFSWYN